MGPEAYSLAASVRRLDHISQVADGTYRLPKGTDVLADIASQSKVVAAQGRATLDPCDGDMLHGTGCGQCYRCVAQERFLDDRWPDWRELIAADPHWLPIPPIETRGRRIAALVFAHLQHNEVAE